MDIYYYMHESSWTPYQLYDMGDTLEEVKENFQQQFNLTDTEMDEYDIWKSTKHSQDQIAKHNIQDPLNIHYL